MMLFLLKLFAKLPLEWLRVIGSGLGFLLYHFAPSIRRTVSANLQQANIDLHPRLVIQHNARGLADMIWVWFHDSAQVAKRCTLIDSVRITMLQTSGQAAMLISPHLGCFEVIAKWWTVGTPLTAMYRKPDKPWLAHIIAHARKAPFLQMAPANASGVRSVLKALKQNTAIYLLPDQAPRQGEGLWLPWFDRLAYTITLPAKLQASAPAPMYVLAVIPNSKGWDIYCEPIETESDIHSNTERLTLQINAAQEQMIRRFPQYYAWGYRRYKGTPPTNL